MRKLSIVIASILLVAGFASAADNADVMKPVHQFIDGFNKGDAKSALAACADEAYIIDEFPPYEWHGPGACGKWAADYDADAKKNGITPGSVTLGKPRHIDVAGDRAYVVVPTTYEFTQRGKAVKQTGATLSVALQKLPAGWRIVAWSWATGSRH